MNKTIAILTFLLLGASLQLSAQKIWTDPVEYKTPEDSVTIFVDLTMMDCDKLVGHPGPLYLWSWMPAEPLVGNGAWGASNTDLFFICSRLNCVFNVLNFFWFFLRRSSTRSMTRILACFMRF